MYEVHPDNEGRWILYQVGDGGFDLVAWFADREDAEFARQAFENRASANTGGSAAGVGVTAVPA